MPPLRSLQPQPFRPAWNPRNLLSAVHHARSFASSSGNDSNEKNDGPPQEHAAEGSPHPERRPLIRTVVMGTGKFRPEEQVYVPLNARRPKRKPRPQNAQPAEAHNASDQRLQELESLLNVARAELAKLQKQGSELNNSDRIPAFGKSASQEWKLPGFSEDQVRPKETSEAVKDSGSKDSSGVRYLSKQPGKPLPHTTAEAIPQSLRGSQPFPPANNQAHHKSLAEELFPEDTKIDSSQTERASQRNTDAKAKSQKVDLRDFIPDMDSKKSSKAQASAERLNEARGSLLPELFPELAKEKAVEEEEKTQSEREVPRLRLDADLAEEELRPVRRSLKEKYMEKIEASTAENLVVLRLFGASKNLTEEDFRRVLPPSKHVEGWTGPGDFIKVIPERDMITLDQTDRYFIIFPNIESARIYQGCAFRFNELANQHAPTSLTSPLATPPGMDQVLGKDADVHHAVNAFTLGMGNQLILKMQAKPYEPWMARFLHRGGYENVAIEAADAGIIAARVLFRLEGAQPSVLDLRRALQHESKKRGRPWGISTHPDGPMGVLKLDLSSRNEVLGDAGQATMLRRTVPRYVINFESKAEAVRFVKEWNRRPFHWDSRKLYENGEGAPIAHAELLW